MVKGYVNFLATHLILFFTDMSEKNLQFPVAADLKQQQQHNEVIKGKHKRTFTILSQHKILLLYIYNILININIIYTYVWLNVILIF